MKNPFLVFFVASNSHNVIKGIVVFRLLVGEMHGCGSESRR
jgi:hypothetical protein